MFTTTFVIPVSQLSGGHVILIDNIPHYVDSVRADLAALTSGKGPHSIHCVNLKTRIGVEWIRDGESQIPVIRF